jgi:hypothetical protein
MLNWVHLPEFPSQNFVTHGATYDEALANGLEVVDLLVESYQEEGRSFENYELRIGNGKAIVLSTTWGRAIGLTPSHSSCTNGIHQEDVYLNRSYYLLNGATYVQSRR